MKFNLKKLAASTLVVLSFAPAGLVFAEDNGGSQVKANSSVKTEMRKEDNKGGNFCARIS